MELLPPGVLRFYYTFILLFPYNLNGKHGKLVVDKDIKIQCED